MFNSILLLTHLDRLALRLAHSCCKSASISFATLVYAFGTSPWRAGTVITSEYQDHSYGTKFLYRSELQGVINSKELFIATHNDSCLMSLHISIRIYIRHENPLVLKNVWVFSCHYPHTIFIQSVQLINYGHKPPIFASALHSLDLVSWVCFSDSADNALNPNNSPLSLYLSTSSRLDHVRCPSRIHTDYRLLCALDMVAIKLLLTFSTMQIFHQFTILDIGLLWWTKSMKIVNSKYHRKLKRLTHHWYDQRPWSMHRQLVNYNTPSFTIFKNESLLFQFTEWNDVTPPN